MTARPPPKPDLDELEAQAFGGLHYEEALALLAHCRELRDEVAAGWGELDALKLTSAEEIRELREAARHLLDHSAWVAGGKDVGDALYRLRSLVNPPHKETPDA